MPPKLELELPGTRLAPKGSIVGIWLTAIGIVLLIGTRYDRSLLLPALGLCVVGVVVLVYGLRRAHGRAQAAREQEPPSEQGTPKS